MHILYTYIFLLPQLNYTIYPITSCIQFRIIFTLNWLLKQIFTRNMLYPCTYILTDHLFLHPFPTSITPSLNNSNNNAKKKIKLRTVHPYSFIIAKGWIDEW